MITTVVSSRTAAVDRMASSLKADCFAQIVDSETGERRRGRWSVEGTAEAVQGYLELCDYAGTGSTVTAPRVGRGIDGDLWVFDRGVWRPGKRDIHEVIVTLLADDYSPARQTSTEKYLQGSAHLPIIEGLPVSGYLNFRNGLLHWETGEFYGHNPTVLSTVQLGCNWMPTATCEKWLEFLTEVLPPDALDIMQEIFGYLLHSGEPLHKAFMFNGSGRNGKGTVLGVLETLLGAENITHISVQSMAGSRFASAGLFGRLANIVGDMSATFVKETDTFKSATGGDSIDAERKGRDAFQFTPFASHIFSTNKLPMFADSSPGFMDRWLVMPFPNTFSESKRDPKLKTKLTEPAELEGIAAWAVAGLQRLMTRGRFDLPPSLLDAKEEFAVAVNPVQAFLRECAERSSGSDTKCSDLYAVYRSWISAQGRTGAPKGDFYSEVESLGITRLKTGGLEVFRGMRLTKSAMDFHAEPW